jgi:cytochrome c553
MKNIIAAAMLFLAGLSGNPVVAADDVAGRDAFNNKGCVGCHGTGGLKPIANYPVIGGQATDFIMGELTKFRAKTRIDPIMNAMAATLSDDDIANIAAFLGMQK